MARALTRPSMLGAAVGLLAGVLFMLGAQPSRLEPVILFDESYDLMLVRHLSRTGQYAMEIKGTKLRWFDPEATTGPTVLVPQAIGLWASGSLLTVPRAIMLAYLALFTVALYLAARKLGGWLGGAIAMVTLLWVSWDIYDLGLRVLGEVPALAFLFLGVAALARTTSPRSWLLGGICIGLALLTKPQLIIATAALLLALGVWHYRCDDRCYESTLSAVVGVAAPILIWLSIQLLVLGPSEWYRVNEGMFLLVTSQGFSGGVTQAFLALDNTPLSVVIVLVLMCIYCLWMIVIHRIAKRFSLLLRVVLLLSILIPLPFVQPIRLTKRLLPLWNHNPFEVSVACLGLFIGLLFALVKNDRWLAFISVCGIFFLEWSVGISEIYGGVRYTIYWRVLGLLSFAVVGAALLQRAGRWFSYSMARRPLVSSRAGRTAGLLTLLGGVALMISHALPQIRYTVPAEYDGGFGVATARWLGSSTPSDAILLGDGWWMPLEAAYLANRDVADLRTSAFARLDDLRRPVYLAVFEGLLDEGLLLPATEAILRRDDLQLFRNGGFRVMQWPRSPALEALSTVEHTDLNLLEEIDAGRATFLPAPREGLLDHRHGQFIFPAPTDLRQGLIMISSASVSTRPFKVQPTSRLFLGFTPPDAGDGLRLAVSVQSSGSKEPATLWEQDIAPGGKYELHVISLEAWLNEDVALTISVGSPTGDTTADWLHVSPLIVGSQ